MNHKNICRFCLINNFPILHDIFNISVENMNLIDVIRLHFNIEVKHEDELKEICTECCDRIREFHLYYRKVLENQKQLLKKFTQKTFKEEQNYDTLDETLNIEVVNIVPESRISIPISNQPKTELPNTELVKIEPEINDYFYNETGNTIFVSELPTVSSSLQEENEDEVKSESVGETVTQNQGSQPMDVDVRRKTRIVKRRNRNSNKKVCDVDKTKTDEEENDCNEESSTSNKQNTAKRKTDDFEYPKIIIEDNKFVVTGNKLLNLLERFYVLSCDLCEDESNRFKSIAALFQHYQKHHNVKPYVKCYDGEKFYNRQTMAYHMARHLQPDAFTCPICGKMVLRSPNLPSHIANHLPEEERQYSCPKCPKKFGHLITLTAHQLTHRVKPKRLCKDCGESFDTETQLKKHLINVHSVRMREYMCDICGKKLSSSGNLSDHIETHNNIKLIQCEICHKWFKNKSNFRLHMTHVHSKAQHKCDHCDFTIHSLRTLKCHIRNKHLRKSNTQIQCTVCEKTFKSKYILKFHMTQHTGIPNYTCEFCKKQFASNGNYYSHRKRMHPNELKELKIKQDEEARILREKALKDQLSKVKLK